MEENFIGRKMLKKEGRVSIDYFTNLRPCESSHKAIAIWANVNAAGYQAEKRYILHNK
jgi:hypothetical protein